MKISLDLKDAAQKDLIAARALARKAGNVDLESNAEQVLREFDGLKDS